MISVVLPIYNVEEYIEECLNSILNQTIGEENIEIILVDDCSTDSTAKIILDFKNKFSNFKLYSFSKNNGSPGKPRNKGASLASGEFIHFMDPDDVLEPYAYETLLKNINEKDDFIMGKMMGFNEDGSTFQHVTFRDYKLNKTYKSIKLKEVPFFAQVKVGVVVKLIRKSFYDKNNIRFIEDMKNGEDKYVDAMLYEKANSFSYIPTIIYKYRNRDNGENKSLTHQDIEQSIHNDLQAYEIVKKVYSGDELEFFKINALRSLFWKILDKDFFDLGRNYGIDIIKQLEPVVHKYNEDIFNLYMKNEIPIIKFISKKESTLAYDYAFLLYKRRKSYYDGIKIEQFKRQEKKFRQSKSYKMYKVISQVKKLCRNERI